MTSFTVTSDGCTRKEFVAGPKKARWNLSEKAKQILMRSNKEFVATQGTSFNLPVIKGEQFKDDERIYQKILTKGKSRGYLTPTMEHAALLAEAVTPGEIQQMGMTCLIVMHEQFIDSEGGFILTLFPFGEKGLLDVCYCSADHSWHPMRGFVFLAPQ